ncbi:DNA repair protein rev1 [Sphaceloma murrayae]|uniref:DNA repair protein REV1 n=1 Tax=Sphaceloma murrayae TaxID=2082308 RepID=A0A2K1QLX2_9PEZI|nr:DNA repair protein rev1 [Sphaceloma murrayae]
MGSRLEQKSNEVRKRIENHKFGGEDGDEYEGSKFGGFSDYFRRKKIKLQNLDADLRARSGDKPPIFRGVVAHVNGYTQPSLNDLHELIVSHGGGFIQYLDGKTMVTHIIASSLTPKKAVEFKRYRIVKPAWIVDSVTAGRLLPWNDYRVVDEGVGQKVLGFQNGQVVSQVNNRARGYKDQTDASWYTSQLQRELSPPSSVPREPGSDLQHFLTPAEGSSFGQDDLERLDQLATLAQQHHTRDIPVEHDGPREHTSLTNRAESSLQTPPQSSLVRSIRHATPPSAKPIVEDPGSMDVDPAKPSADSPSESEQQVASLKRANSSTEDTPRKAAKLTAEEHNAILLADPRIRRSTVVHPDFLEQYYRESRLHHLSTWKADLKSQLRALTEDKSSSQKAKQKRPAGARRYVMHVDFDSFFVAVSLKKAPQYADKPCVVAHGSGPGSEIASCNYPARKFGVSNGMWMKKALDLCKDLEVLPYDFPGYEEASRKFYDAILATGGIVQSVSIDEALVDISMLCIQAGGTDGLKRNEGAAHREELKADEIARDLRKQVLEATGCNVSVGIGGNILLAKVALRKAKPAGQYHLKPEDVIDFIGALEVQSLPGVAWSLGGKLESMGIKFVKDIRETTKENLTSKLGPKTGEKLWDYARGIDRTEVGDVVLRKSVSAEVNWGVRFENQEQVVEFIENLCGELHKRLLKEKVKGRQLTLKIMRRAANAPLDPPKNLGHGLCDTYNKTIQLGIYTNDAKLIAKETLAIMRSFSFSPGELRGIGVQMQKLEPIKNEGLVEGSQRRLHFKMDSLPKQPSEQLGKVTTDANDAIQDDIQTPKANRVQDASIAMIPMKLLADSPSKKPLNILGTQFVMPTQVDPAVLAELPEDIRARLMKQAKQTSPPRSIGYGVVPENEYRGRTESPALELPTESQLDVETLAALPADVRSEVLALYKTNSNASRNQTVLPQSPRKNRTLPPGKVTTTRRRGRGGLFSSRTARSDTPTLTQANFVALARNGGKGDAADSGAESESADLDPDFLAALPPDLRQEVVDNHRQERLRRTGGIDLTMHQRSRQRGRQKREKAEAVERLFKLPPRPPKPTFTKQKLSELEDLRGMIRNWVREFGDEDPFDEDVKALVEYLGQVIKEERDMDKAVRVVKWLGYVVDTESEGKWEGDEMKDRWGVVLGKVKQGVQAAVQERGLGSVDWD